MNFKITALLGTFLIILVGFVVFYERPRMEKEKLEAEADHTFVDVTRQTVAKLKVVNRFGKFVAEKRGTEWLIVEPVETPGDWGLLESLVSAAREVQKGRVIVNAENYAQTDLSAFGLAPPRVEVLFEDKMGADIRLSFGDDNPAGRAAYLSWSGGNQVVLAQRSDRNRFDVQLMDLRDKRILPFDLDKVQQIVIKHSGQTFEMVRNGFTWQIVRPKAYLGDGAEINNILGTIRSERIVEVVAETIEDPSRYGFDAPGYDVTLTYKDGSTRTLILGKETEDDRLRLWYARSSERPFVFLAEPFMTDFLRIDLSDIRYKRVFEFERDGIDRIQLAYADSIVSCVLEGGRWQVKKPQGYEIDKSVVNSWIDKVYTMAVADFVGEVEDLAKYGLLHPGLVVSLWRGDVLVREVLVGLGVDGWYGQMDGSQEVFSFDDGVMSGLRLPLFGMPNQKVQAGAQ